MRNAKLENTSNRSLLFRISNFEFRISRGHLMRITDIETFAGKKVLVTGGLGFIGSNVARRLVELEAQVTLVDSLVPVYGGNPFNIRGIEDKVHVNIADVRDEHGMAYLVKGHELIFNLAGQVSHIDSMEDPYTDLEINVRAQISILEACRKNNRDVKIVYTALASYTASRPICRLTRSTSLSRPTRMASTNFAASCITSSITTSTECARSR